MDNDEPLQLRIGPDEGDDNIYRRPLVSIRMTSVETNTVDHNSIDPDDVLNNDSGILDINVGADDIITYQH
jgi:hypothetical protein